MVLILFCLYLSFLPDNTNLATIIWCNLLTDYSNCLAIVFGFEGRAPTITPEDARPHSYRVESDESLIRGGIDELEQVTTFRVFDTATDEVNLTFEGLRSASVDSDSGS